MDTLYAIAFVLSAAISLFVAVSAWRKRPAPGAFGLALLCFGQFQWSAAYALQWMFTDHSASTFWFLVRFVGLQITPTAILIMVLGFTGRTRWLNARVLALLAIQPVASFMIALTDPLHGLYLGGLEPALKIIDGGPVWWFNIAYSYSVMLFAAGLIVARLVRQRMYRLQTSVVLVAVMLPVVHFLVQLTGVDLLPRVNSVPFTFTITGLLEWFALTRLGLFRVIPIARDQLVEQMADGIIVFDASRHIVDINPTAARMTGVTSTCIGKTADEAFPEYAETIAALRAGLETGKPTTVRSGFGNGGTMEVTASEVLGGDKSRLATLVTLRDITARTRAEAELKTRSDELASALERSRSILAAMSDGVLLVDADTRILEGNDAAGSILDLSAREVRGATVRDIMPSLHAEEQARAAMRTGMACTTTHALAGGRSLIVEAIPLREGSSATSARTLFVIRDETERLAAERMQREFIANAAHELQTPLTGLSLLAETIPRALEKDPVNAAGFISRLSVEIDRLVRMTRSLMTLSRVDDAIPGHSDRIDLSQTVAEEMADAGLRTAETDRTLLADIAPGLVVAGDELDVRVILGNLLGNAIRYTDEGGHIRVQLTAEDHDADGRYAVLRISDTGLGIPEGDLDRIFERFYRVDKARSRRTGGAGLGLSIVRGAVDRLGGTVSVESALGMGSTFTVTLPMVGPATQEPTDSGPGQKSDTAQ